MKHGAITCRCGRQDKRPIEVRGLLLCRECAYDEIEPTIGRKTPQQDFRYIAPAIRRTG